MWFYQAYFILICIIGFGHPLNLNDEEQVSDIIFFNRSYIEIILKSSNQSMNIWLNPFPTNGISNRKVIDEKCLFEGNITFGSGFKGTAIISFCGQNMTGILDFNGTTYSLVYEMDRFSSNNYSNDSLRRKRSTNTEHISSRIISRIKDLDNIGVCGNGMITEDYEGVMTRSWGYEQIPDEPDVNFGRAVIKLSVFVDEMLFIHRFSSDLSETKNFVGIHIAYLQKQLQQKIILRNIEIELVIVHFSIAPFYDTHLWDTFKYLNRFCKWARSNSSQFSDVNILLTGSQLWWIQEGKVSLSINGLANVARICDPLFACMIIEARSSFMSIRTLVHEFGHTAFGAQHDGQEKFNTSSCGADKHIMSPYVADRLTTWSECSAKYLRQLMLSLKRNEKTNQVECLTKAAKPIDKQLDIKSSKLKRPGEFINADKQCQMIYGSNSKNTWDSESNICLSMRCDNNFYTTNTWPVLEGTKCGLNRECRDDRCRRRPLSNFNPYVDFGKRPGR